MTRAPGTAALVLTLATVLGPLAGCATGTSGHTPRAAAATVESATATVRTAVADSDADGRPVLLVLHDDGPASGRLTALLARPRVAAVLATDFHVVRVDVAGADGRRVAATHAVRLARSGVPAVAVLVGGQAVYAGGDGLFARPGRISTQRVVHWLHRWS